MTIRINLLASASGAVALFVASQAYAQVIDYPDGSNRTTPIVANNTTQLQVLTGSATQSGVISGATNGLSKIGAGTRIVTADNTYTGAFTVGAGTMQVGADETTAVSPAMAPP